MNSRERIKKSISHQKVDKLPIDFGSTPVSGIMATVVYKLRQYFKLDNPGTPVKIVEPYQMLGEIKDDLKEILGLDCVGVWPLKNMFGFENKNWKEWRLFDGTPVLVPELFNTEPTEDGDILMYPEGDKSCKPSARMPKGGFYFDAIIRQNPIKENELNVEDNLEEFQYITDRELDYFEKEIDYLHKNTEYAIVANFGGTSFGDIALVPAPFLKNPKGIRDVEEWYISTITRQKYIYEVFEKQCEIALKNLEKIHKRVQDKVDVVYICGADFGAQNKIPLSASVHLVCMTYLLQDTSKCPHLL